MIRNLDEYLDHLEDLYEEMLEEEEEEEEENEEDEEEEEEDEEIVLSQEEFDKKVKSRVAKAKRSAVKEILEALGVSSVEDAKAKLAKPKPEEKGKGAPAGTKEEVDVEEIREDIRKEYQAQVDEINLSHEIEAMIIDRYGVTAKAAKKMRNLVDVELDAEEDEIEEALEDLEKDMPQLFKKDDDEEEEARNLRLDRERHRNTNPGRSPRSPRGKGKDPKSAARTLLHERHPQTRKTQ